MDTMQMAIEAQKRQEQYEREAEVAKPFAVEMLVAMRELLSLRVAVEELKWLDSGVGTKTPNAAWLRAREIVTKIDARLGK